MLDVFEILKSKAESRELVPPCCQNTENRIPVYQRIEPPIDPFNPPPLIAYECRICGLKQQVGYMEMEEME